MCLTYHQPLAPPLHTHKCLLHKSDYARHVAFPTANEQLCVVRKLYHSDPVWYEEAELVREHGIQYTAQGAALVHTDRVSLHRRAHGHTASTDDLDLLSVAA